MNGKSVVLSICNSMKLMEKVTVMIEDKEFRGRKELEDVSVRILC
jgi:hypothetical protein